MFEAEIVRMEDPNWAPTFEIQFPCGCMALYEPGQTWRLRLTDQHWNVRFGGTPKEFEDDDVVDFNYCKDHQELEDIAYKAVKDLFRIGEED